MYLKLWEKLKTFKFVLAVDLKSAYRKVQFEFEFEFSVSVRGKTQFGTHKLCFFLKLKTRTQTEMH